VEKARYLLKEEVLLVNPNDIFEDNAYANLLAGYKKDKTVAFIIGCKVKSYFPGGYLVVKRTGTAHPDYGKTRTGQ